MVFLVLRLGLLAGSAMHGRRLARLALAFPVLPRPKVWWVRPALSRVFGETASRVLQRRWAKMRPSPALLPPMARPAALAAAAPVDPALAWSFERGRSASSPSLAESDFAR